MPGDASELRLTLAATRAEVGRVCAEVRRFLGGKGTGEDAIDDLCLALDEVLANVVLHGYGSGPGGRVSVVLAVADEECTVEVCDQAPPFDPLAAPPPVLDDDPAKRGIGGLGLHLLRTLMDEVTYERAGSDNVLRLRRRSRR